MQYVGAGFSRPVFLAPILLAMLAGFACNAVPPLDNIHATPEGLADSILDALQANDRASLLAFALSEQEFRDHVWPGLAAAQPPPSLPMPDVWRDLKQKSDAALDATMARHGGRRYELVQVGFAGGETDYGAYRVLREATFHVRARDGGTEGLRIAGSFIEKGDAWKVFSYVIDE